MTRARPGRAIHLIAIFTASLVAVASGSYAHDRTTSYSTWYVSQREAKIVLRVDEVDLAVLPWASGEADSYAAALATYAVEHLVLLAGEQVCEVIEPPRRLEARAGRIALEWSVACPAEGPLRIRSDLLFDVRSSHLHFVSLRHEEGDAERVLSYRQRSWSLGDEADGVGTAASTSAASYGLLGIRHIATGYDHLVFLLALLLVGGSFISLAKVVSGFTIGHSLTLALASLGLVRPEIESIEALIGLSIVLVAVENVWLLGPRRYFLPVTVIVLLVLLAIGSALGLGLFSGLKFVGFALFVACYYPLLRKNPRAESARWGVAMLFGLIHGFGFASVLLAADLPPARIPAVLLSFNLGVEAGQLALVAVAWPLIRFALKRWGTIVVELGSAVTICLGTYWLIERMWAGLS